jgi:hypothetical protein
MSPRDPITVACPACKAKRGQPCRSLTYSDRRPMVDVHTARDEAANSLARGPINPLTGRRNPR